MNESLEILPLITHASLIVKAVMAILVLLSLIGWTLIFRLGTRLSSSTHNDDAFGLWFLDNGNPHKCYQALDNNEQFGLAHIFYMAYTEYLRLIKALPSQPDIADALERKCRVGLGRQQSELEQGLATLASIASVSPYIGLFGTVWGIMTAFIGLGQAQSISLATVAPGIAEALIATAMGLFAAIPASLAFNHFSAKASTLYEKRSLFCDEVTGMILRQHLQAQHRKDQLSS